MTSNDFFSNAEITAYLASAHWARLVQQLHGARRRQAHDAAARQARREREQAQREARLAHRRESAKAARDRAAAQQRESAAAAAERAEWERRVLDGLREQLSDALGDANSAAAAELRLDAPALAALCARLSADVINELLLLKPKPLLARARALLTDRDEPAAARAPPWTDDELSALSRGMARFPGGTPNRWDCIHDRFLPSRSPKEIVAKSRQVDSLNSAELLKARELVRSDFEQLQARNAATATTAAMAAMAAATATAAATTTTTASTAAAAPAAATTPWSADEQARLEEALKLFPGAVADKARWELIAQHVGRSKRECVERVRECAAHHDAMAKRARSTCPAGRVFVRPTADTAPGTSNP